MPILKNPRWEKFCQELAKGKTQTQAYLSSGYDCTEDTARTGASALMTKHNILARLEELQERAAKRTIVTVESLLDEAELARQLAMRIDQPSAAIAAVREKGVLSGKRVERHEAGKPGEFDMLDNMTAEELTRFVYGDDDEKRTEH